jgi:hypothetical protein
MLFCRDDRPSLQMIECIKYKKMEDRVQPFELYISLEYFYFYFIFNLLQMFDAHEYSFSSHPE